jgi:hypothetical protein
MPGSANLSVLLLLDSHHLDFHEGLGFHIGQPTLVSTFTDPCCFIGWGYPSVWKSKSGGGYKAVYQGWKKPTSQHAVSETDAKLGLLAESIDGVAWHRAPGQGILNVSNAIHDANNGEFSVVYDDPLGPSAHLKMLTGPGPVLLSTDDGQHWIPNGTWTSKGIDPGIGLYRNPLNQTELVVTARPQSLRHGGRHAGYHTGGSWAALGLLENAQALPIDSIYENADQMYGMPMFAYEQLAIGYLWRYRCAPTGTGNTCFSGGKISSAIAYSYDSKSFMAFGQQEGLDGPSQEEPSWNTTRLHPSQHADIPPQSDSPPKQLTRYMIGIDIPIDTYR